MGINKLERKILVRKKNSLASCNYKPAHALYHLPFLKNVLLTSNVNGTKIGWRVGF